MYKCKHCGKEFEDRYKLTGHSTHCKMNPNYERNILQSTKNVNSGNKNKREKYLKDKVEYYCQYCNKKCVGKNSLKNHENRCNKNPNKKVLNYNNLEKYNEEVKNGLHKHTNQYIKSIKLGLPYPKVSKETREKISLSSKNQVWTKERKDNLSLSMHKAVLEHPESYSSSNVNVRVKKREYREIMLDSEWEVVFAKFLDEKKIKWVRPSSGKIYKYKGVEHLYFPDFYLQEYDLYVEVKGYIRDRDYYKWKSLDNLVIITLKEIKKIKRGEFAIENLFE